MQMLRVGTAGGPYVCRLRLAAGWLEVREDAPRVRRLSTRVAADQPNRHSSPEEARAGRRLAARDRVRAASQDHQRPG